VEVDCFTPNYKTIFFTLELSKIDEIITSLSGFGWQFCYNDSGFVFFLFIYFVEFLKKIIVIIEKP